MAHLLLFSSGGCNHAVTRALLYAHESQGSSRALPLPAPICGLRSAFEALSQYHPGLFVLVRDVNRSGCLANLIKIVEVARASRPTAVLRILEEA